VPWQRQVKVGVEWAAISVTEKITGAFTYLILDFCALMDESLPLFPNYGRRGLTPLGRCYSLQLMKFHQRTKYKSPILIIRRAKLITETSFETLYEGQPLFDNIYQKVVSWGFRYQGTLHQIDNPKDGSVLQADSIFIKDP
jgi:hypothetical protein